MPGIGRSERSAAGDGAPAPEESTGLAFDCSDPAHEEAHITAETADVLVEKVLRHFATYHPDVPEEQVRESVAASAYAERPESDEASVASPPNIG